jgi:hypothetical protein
MNKAFISRNREKGNILKTLLPLLLFAMVVVAVAVGVQNVSATADDERLNAMEQAVRRSVVQCYAIEGRYPPNLNYLESGYGLVLDREKYVYHYQSVGANLLPQIAVYVLD